MHKFVRKLITEWRRLSLPFDDETIVVAVSGGADSVSLLLALHELRKRKKLRLRIVAAHFNHRLRGKTSDADETFVRNLAADRGLEFIAGRGRGKLTGNIEEKARDERYRFLSGTARKANAKIVLTAHTVNDQAETFLLNLIRGSGPDGLAGMSTTRKLDDRVDLVRPLLSWATRNDTESFCRENAIAFRIDEMNSDERFTRVRLRRTIIPKLAEINPKVVETFARTAELIRSQITTTNDLPESAELRLKDIRTLPKPELYRQIRSWLRHRRGNLRGVELKHIESVERLLNSRKSGKTVEIPGGGRVVKEQGALIFRNIKVEK